MWKRNQTVRIKDSERRMLNRRLKNRLPPIALSAKPKKRGKAQQATLMIVATFFLTPEAFARLSDNRAEAVFTRTYTKDDLKAPDPVQSRGLGEILKEHATALFTRMTQQQSGNNVKMLEFQGQVRELTKEERAMRLDGFAQDDDRKLDSKGLVSFLRRQSQKAAGEHVKESNELFRKVKNGMAVKFSLGDLFKTKPKNQQLAEGTVRYGLLIKDIIPDNKGMARAAVAGSNPQDLQYAGHAEVQWTIGPVYEEKGRKVFNFTEEHSNEEADSSLWSFVSKIRVPSPNFSARIEPGSTDEAMAASEGGKAKMPIKATIAQEEGYYTMTYVATGAKGAAVHDIKIPVAGELAVGRRFNDKFDVIQSSAYNVLVDKRAPIVSVHYLHVEDRFKSEIVSEKPGRRVSLEASKQRKKVDQSTLPADQRDNYVVKYSKEF